MNTLTDKLKEVVLKDPQRVVVQIKTDEGYEQYTYREMYDAVQSIQEILLGFGIRRHDKVAIISENRPEWGFIYFGILLAGAIAVPLDVQSNPDEVKFLLDDSESKAVIVSKNFRSLLNRVNSGCEKDQFLISDMIFYPVHELSDEKPEQFEPSPRDIASIIYTSGTTGVPKGVMLTHQNFCANFESAKELQILSDQHNVLSVLPLHHSFPFMVNLIIPLFSQSVITYVSSLKHDELLACMQETGVTVFVGVPQIFYMFYRQMATRIRQIPWYVRLPFLACIEGVWAVRKYLRINLAKWMLYKMHRVFGPNLKFFVTGGAKLDEGVMTFFMKMGFTILEGYGLTETSPVVTFNPIQKPKIGSAGKPIPNVKVKIVDLDSEGIGEIVISGPNVMQGYYHRQAETNEVLKDQWFYSGDLGYLDQDGYLYVTGRKKELIVLSSGKNIAPEEVETHYVKSPYIKELCVLAVGERVEEKLMAVIVPDFEYYRKKGEVNVYNTLRWDLENLSKHYPAYKRIMGFVITKQELPRTRLGKLKRFEIRDHYLSELMGVEAPVTQEEVIALGEEELRLLASEKWDYLKAILEETFQIREPLQLSDHLELDLGIDSLGRVELMTALEKTLHVHIPEAYMARIFTLKELMKAIEQEHIEEGAVKKPQVPIWNEILKMPPSPVLLKKLSWSLGPLARFLTIVGYKFLYSIFRIFWRLKVTGAENLPKEAAFILCSNHNSYFDGFLIAVSIPIEFTKKLFFLGFRAYFELPVISTLAKLFKIIPVNPNVELIDAMQICAYVLLKGYSVCIFPEGERSIDGQVKRFRPGIGVLAQELQVPLIPVFIQGSYGAWPRGKRFPKFYPITVMFGKPQSAQDLKHRGLELGAKGDYNAIALGAREAVMEIVAEPH
jgi:long-chain acyl-CoA synthetase